MSTTSQFYKVSCVDTSNQCNYAQPIDTNLDMTNRINIFSGSAFNQEDKERTEQAFTRICSQFDGKERKCCDPTEYRYKVTKEQLEKYPKVNVNRNNAKDITSVEICQDPKKCPSGDGKQWIPPTPYLLCKIGDNQLEQKSDNVLQTTTVSPDCYANDRKCDPNKFIGLNHLTSQLVDKDSYDYYDDARLASFIKEDNLTQIKSYFEKPLNRRPDINRRLTHDDASDTMLHRACLDGAVKIVRYLITNQAELNMRNYYGETPLMCAIKVNNIEIVSFLLNQNADQTIRNNKGQNTLAYAVIYADISMLRLLYNNQGDINNIDNDGNTLLHLIVKYSQNKKDFLIFCLERGVNINLKNKDGKTALDVAEDNKLDYSQLEDQLNQKFFLSPTLETFEDGTFPNKKELNEVTGILRKAYYKTNKNKFQDFFKENVPKASSVEINRWGCAGGDASGLEETENECHSVGGQWYEYYDNENSGVDANNEVMNNQQRYSIGDNENSGVDANNEVMNNQQRYSIGDNENDDEVVPSDITPTITPTSMTKVPASNHNNSESFEDLKGDDHVWWVYDKPSTKVKIEYPEENTEVLDAIDQESLYKPKYSQLIPLKSGIFKSHDEIMAMDAKKEENKQNNNKDNTKTNNKANNKKTTPTPMPTSVYPINLDELEDEESIGKYPQWLVYLVVIVIVILMTGGGYYFYRKF